MIQEITSKAVQTFIAEHEHERPTELALKYAHKSDLPIQLIVSQIKSRQKAKSKLPKWYQTENIIFPHGVPLEQCSSEKAAQYKANLINGKHLVDLTGGTGIDTYYLSKQFEQTTYVEQNTDLCNLARHNFSTLKTKISVENETAESYINNNNEKINWFYIDPARRDSANKKLFKISDCQPNLIELLPLLLSKKANVLIKYSPMLDIKEVINALANIEAVHIISIDNECKEVLFIIKNGCQGEPNIHTINLTKDRKYEFSFTYYDELNHRPKYSKPLQYLYEPNASILKAGGFKSITSKFNIQKIHSNTHLYTSAELIKGFHGRTFKILAVEHVSAKYLKKYLDKGKANLTLRNFPITTDQLRKKLKIKDGGNTYVFATTIFQDQLRLIICEKS